MSDVETSTDVEVDWIVIDEWGRRFTHGKTRAEAVANAKQCMLDVMEARAELEAIGKSSSVPLPVPVAMRQRANICRCRNARNLGH